MFRYLALAWNANDQLQQDAVSTLEHRILALPARWKLAFTHRGIRVYSAYDQRGALEPRVLANGNGVVLGAAFAGRSDAEDDGPSRALDLSPANSQAIVQSRGRWLIENCWGNYVALIVNATGKAFVVKDPTGSLPCFCTTHGRVALVFSNAADCVDLQLKFTLNQSFLHAWILGIANQAHPSLNEVVRIHGGECAEIDVRNEPSARVCERWWSPLAFAAKVPLDEPARAMRAMRATIRGCTSSWARRHDIILHRLSGGLDSSIILACLGHSPNRPRIIALTAYNPHSRSDERPWARLAALPAKCEHIELPVTPADRDLRDALAMRPSVEPLPVLPFLQRSAADRQLTLKYQATAIFNGDGGDSGFCADSISYAVSDYVRHKGIGLGLLRFAPQAALATQRSTLAVLSQAFGSKLGREPTDDGDSMRLRGNKLISAQLLASGSSLENPHPWFASAPSIASPIVRRLGALVGPSDFYNESDDPHGRVCEVIAPLYSQPVVELLLQIPLYLHLHGGRSRGLARTAFASDVPQKILQRQWKDRIPGFLEQLIDFNRSFLQELLLEGVLVKEHCLDRTAVESALSTGPSRSDVLPGEILRHLDTEIWARHWMSASNIATDSRTAAA